MTITMTGKRSVWTGERIARLGFLIGCGWHGYRIAADPIIATTYNNVHRQAQRFGLSFRAAAAASLLHLTPTAVSRFEAAATKRLMTCEALIRLLLSEIGSDPSLLENILDDDCEAPVPQRSPSLAGMRPVSLAASPADGPQLESARK